ncbi:MAG: hypothetical protein U1E67_02120 [Hyphomicrobiales bacterium]
MKSTLNPASPPSKLWRYRYWSLAVLIATLIGCVLWERAFPTQSLRYRLTVEVETPEGIKTGSSVIEVRYSQGMALGDVSGLQSRIWGEAVYVDLGAGRNLVVTLTRSESGRKTARSPSELPLILFKLDTNPLGSWGNPPAQGSRDVAPEMLPTLVTFRDPADPISVKLVEPDQLESAFGPEVRIANATIEITKDNAEATIERHLPWLSDHPEPSLDQGGDPYDASLAKLIHFGDFIRRKT